MAPRDPLSGREVIFEFVSLGDSMRVAAVDVATGEEVIVTGPVSTPQRDLERIAGRKLARKLGLGHGDDPENKTPRRGGRGVIV
ncbi:MAG: hypothetical protein RKE49_09430 [Oceanicaulis sp.]